MQTTEQTYEHTKYIIEQLCIWKLKCKFDTPKRKHDLIVKQLGGRQFYPHLNFKSSDNLAFCLFITLNYVRIG